jgi:hypothetical protein
MSPATGRPPSCTYGRRRSNRASGAPIDASCARFYVGSSAGRTIIQSSSQGKSIGLRRVHHGTPLLSFLQAKEGCARVTRYYYSRRSGCDIEEGCVCKKSRRTGSSAADSQPVVQERFGTLGRYVRGRRRGRWALHRRLQKMLKKKWFLCVAILQPAEHATVPARHHIPRRDSGGCLAVLARVCCCCRRRRRRRRR